MVFATVVNTIPKSNRVLAPICNVLIAMVLVAHFVNMPAGLKWAGSGMIHPKI